MKLHRLEFQAVGPFAGRHVIDMDALGADGLFLLEGPTGSGKSTIIDALTFALYGSTAAEGTGETRIRSTHVGPDVPTYVDLVATVARGTYRFRRTPAFQRPKLRGEGTTEEKASATLWRLTPEDLDAMAATGEVPDGEHLATGAREVSIEAAELIGLTKEQFAQTVVLPQGEFARFLRATSEEREEILQRIFATKIYQEVQEALADAARDHRRALADAAAALRGGAGRYAAHLPEAAEDAPAPGDRLDEAVELVVRGDAEGIEEIEALVGDVDAAMGARLGERRDARDRALTAAAEARERRDAQRALADALSRRAALLARRTALAETEPGARGDAERLAAAERAARVTPSIAAATSARADLERSVAAARAAIEGLPEALANLAGAAAEPLRTDEVHPAPDADLLADAAARAREGVETATARRGGLAEALELEAGLAARRVDLDERAASLAHLRATEEARRRDLEARPDGRAELTARMTTARTATAGRAEAATVEQEARARLDAARRVGAAQAEVAAARERLAAATSTAAAALDAETDLRRRRIEGIAGELAAALVDGEPCEVCGATTHPAPARPGPDQPTPQRIERAERARADAERAQAEARAAVATAEAGLDHWREAAGGVDLPAATAAHDAAARALAAAVRASDDAAAAEAERETFDARTEALQKEAERAAATLVEQRAHLETAEEVLTADRRSVEAARGPAESVAERAAVLDAEAGAARALARALEVAEAGRRRVDEAEGQLAEVLAQEEFPSAEAAAAAAMPAGERERLARARRERATEEQRVADGLAAEDVTALTGEETTDVPGAEEALAAAEVASTAEAAAFGTAQATAEGASREGARLLAEARGQLSAIAEAAPYVRLASLATAGELSVRRIPLTTFVLMRRFEDMVAAANTRLVAMSSGRYELARTDREEGQRARRIGLGLEVVDHQNDARRAPNTLSGGETFYVSLSLALGLADVVRAEAGGVDLGTLLIDEGFGSLDQETLDVVMAELMRLRDAGRTVGLVSHVTEMQRMIQDKIEVRRVPGRGSTLAVNWMQWDDRMTP